MFLCQFSARTSLLRPLATWCLDTFGEDAPMLVGVRLGPDAVHFQPIQLGEDDPLNDLAGLAAPSDWDVAVVVAPAHSTELPHGGVVAHAVDRDGSSATELDEFCGRRRPLKTIRGVLHTRCVELFDAH